MFEGYPVGDYYEAALPDRDAFCMRDTSHQAAGAEVPGLAGTAWAELSHIPVMGRTAFVNLPAGRIVTLILKSAGEKLFLRKQGKAVV